MSLIILKRLDYRVREMNGERTAPLAAFVGATVGAVSSFGVGLVKEDGEAQFWGLALPHCLITAYRGMKILDKVHEIGHGTICACYYAGQRNLHESNRHYVLELGEQISEVDALRDDLLAEAISDDELDAMLKICNSAENGIDLATWELEVEIEIGVINRTPEVEKVFELAQAATARYEKHQQMSKEALPDEQSFRKFCEDFGVRYLCSAPIGAYDWDWGHEKMSLLDEDIVMTGLHYGGARAIYCTEFPEKSKIFGKIGHPVLSDESHEELVLEAVKYEDGVMYALLEGTYGKAGRGQMRLDDLRALNPVMIGIAEVIQDCHDEATRNYACHSVDRKGNNGPRGLLAKLFNR